MGNLNMKKIQRVELNKFYDADVHCLFCGQKVIDYQDMDNPTRPCAHTLFVANDEGFEYRSERFDQIVREQNIPDEESDDFEGRDTMTDMIEVVDGIKVASYVGPPSGMGVYVGFAPIESDMS